MDDINNWQEKFNECCYAKKLLEKITYLNNMNKSLVVDAIEVKKAIYYAKKYHGTQMRQSGHPFYSHPVEVAYILAEYTGSHIQKWYRTDMIVTALLHDTIEDTELTEELISCIFDERIVSQVQDLTLIKPEGQISSAEMIEKLYHKKSSDILLIKLFDRIHNIQTIWAKSPERAQNIIKETIIYFLVLSKYLELSDIENYLWKLCCTHLAALNYPIHDSTLSYYRLFNLDNYQPLSLAFQNDATQNYIL